MRHGGYAPSLCPHGVVAVKEPERNIHAGDLIHGALLRIELRQEKFSLNMLTKSGLGGLLINGRNGNPA